MPETTSKSTLQTLAVPISIVVAGALIAVAVFYTNSSKPAAQGGNEKPTVQEEIRTVQSDDHILGSSNAKVVIVEYSDTECPFCKQFHNTLHQIISEYGSSGDVAWVYRHFPLEQLHPKAPKEAEALECAADQGGNEMFWKFTNKVYETTGANNALDIGVYNTPKEVPVAPNGEPYYKQKAPRSATDAGQLSDFAKEFGLDVAKFEDCMKTNKFAARVAKDLNEVIAAGGRGTPHSIIITADGEQIPIEGAQPYNVIKTTIDTLLE